MSRRISTKKRFPKKDSKYDNLLVSLLVNRILKSGKKSLAKRIVYKAFELIEFRTITIKRWKIITYYIKINTYKIKCRVNKKLDNRLFYL